MFVMRNGRMPRKRRYLVASRADASTRIAIGLALALVLGLAVYVAVLAVRGPH